MNKHRKQILPDLTCMTLTICLAFCMGQATHAEHADHDHDHVDGGKEPQPERLHEALSAAVANDKDDHDHSNCTHDHSKPEVEATTRETSNAKITGHANHDHTEPSKHEEVRSAKNTEIHDHANCNHDNGKPSTPEHEHSTPTAVTRRVLPTAAQIARFSISTKVVEFGSITRIVRVPGEIKINSDHLAHVLPQTAGIVQHVSVRLGQKVKKGQVLASIASRNLAEAKAAYLTSEERFNLAKEIANREEQLYKKKVSSEQDYLTAQGSLAEAQIQVRSTRQTLLTFGLRPDELPQLKNEAEENFALQRVVAPFNGTVIEKHVVLGEALDETSEVLVIADLSDVWVDLLVSQDDMASVIKGLKVSVKQPDGSETEGVIDFISPLVKRETRTAIARVTLDNSNGQFRPGTFVDAAIHTPSGRNAFIVPLDSVQLVDDQPSVFVKKGKAYELRSIEPGERTGDKIEILEGLSAGESVVSSGAFHLKSELTKSAHSGCSGHSH